MADNPELDRIANTPGYGTGSVFIKKAAAASEALALLPLPRFVNPVVAGTDMGPNQVPLCHFGFSCEDKNDWQISLDAEDHNTWALGDDAMLDAKTVAAIINAYSMGLIVRADTRTPPKVKPLEWEGHELLQVSKCGTYCIQNFLGEVIIKGTLSARFDNMSEAQDAAQADYAYRILDALE